MGRVGVLQEGGSTCGGIADSLCLEQKPTQNCKAILLQLKKKDKTNTSKESGRKNMENTGYSDVTIILLQ